jgi:hypothetical protein
MGNSIRANWHVADLDLPDGDPMQDMSELQSAATIFDLNVTASDLQDQLDAALRKEGRYFERSKNNDGSSLACDIKWSHPHMLAGEGGSLTCYNCPHFTASNDDALSVICRLGREQCDLVEQLAGRRLADSLDTELAAAFARDLEASAELADFALA